MSVYFMCNSITFIPLKQIQSTILYTMRQNYELDSLLNKLLFSMFPHDFLNSC